MITLQDIFNKAWEEFIVKDGEPGVEYDEQKEIYSCKYRTKDGKRCAVGLALPDDFPFEKYPNTNFEALVLKYPELFDIDINKLIFDQCDLFDFQESLHDRLIDNQTGQWAISKEARKEAYLRIAEHFKLTVPTP
jgi:hypothetical protein